MKSSTIRFGALVLALGGLVPASGCFSASSMETSDTEDGGSTGMDDPSAGASTTSTSSNPTTADPSTSSTGMEPEDDDGAEGSESGEGSSSGAETSSTTDDSSDDESSTSDGDVAPQVSETLPADGDAGVLADAAIEIQFSEPMDQAATQAAYQSADIPAGLVTFSWNDAGDRLTVTPAFSLLYALADEVEDPAYSYAFTITTTAESESGIGLDSDVEVEFTTLRRFVQTFDYDSPLSGSVRDLAGPILAGNLGDTNTNDRSRYFVTFDLSTRAPEIVEVQDALMVVSRSNGISGTPFTELGGVVYEPVHYEAIDAATYDVEGIGASDWLFPTIDEAEQTVDVGSSFEALLADPDAYNDQLQFRFLWFPNEVSDDGGYDSILIDQGVNPPVLSLQYLAP